MNQLLEVTNVKSEPTDLISSDRLEIVKQESDFLVHSEIEIKTEPHENENEFPMTASTSFEMYPNYDMKIETDELMVKIEYEDIVDVNIKDPLNVGDEIKVEEQFPTEGKNDETILEKNKDKSYSQGQNQLLIRIDSEHKYKRYVCHVCNKTFKYKQVFDNHLRIHTGEKPYLCTICKKSFTQKNTLDRHMLIHSGEKPHKCDVCKKVFGDKSNLNKHKLIHTGAKLFSCDVCDKLFAQKHHFMMHKRIHSGEKPYACNMCDKAFIQKSYLTKHTRTHTGEKPFSCDVCTKSFADQGNLNKHKKLHQN